MRSTTAEPLLVQCKACGATNRVPAAKLQGGREAVCGRCKAPLSLHSEPLVVTDANFREKVEGSPIPVLMDMWAPWCGPCRYLSPVVDELAGELAGRVLVAKMNVDQNPATSARFRIQSIPALLLFQGGHEVDRIVGVQPKAEILKRVGRLIG